VRNDSIEFLFNASNQRRVAQVFGAFYVLEPYKILPVERKGQRKPPAWHVTDEILRKLDPIKGVVRYDPDEAEKIGVEDYNRDKMVEGMKEFLDSVDDQVHAFNQMNDERTMAKLSPLGPSVVLRELKAARDQIAVYLTSIEEYVPEPPAISVPKIEFPKLDVPLARKQAGGRPTNVALDPKLPIPDEMRDAARKGRRMRPDVRQPVPPLREEELEQESA